MFSSFYPDKAFFMLQSLAQNPAHVTKSPAELVVLANAITDAADLFTRNRMAEEDAKVEAARRADLR